MWPLGIFSHGCDQSLEHTLLAVRATVYCLIESNQSLLACYVQDISGGLLQSILIWHSFGVANVTSVTDYRYDLDWLCNYVAVAA